MYRCKEWVEQRTVFWSWWEWWMLYPGPKEAPRYGTFCSDHLWHRQSGPSTEQHLRGKAHCQETSDPNADHYSCHVLCMLDASILCQHLEGFRPKFSPERTFWSPHLLYSAAVLHLSLCQPHHLLLHEHPLPQGSLGHLWVLQAAMPEPEEEEGRWWWDHWSHRGVHNKVQLYHR